MSRFLTVALTEKTDASLFHIASFKISVEDFNAYGNQAHAFFAIVRSLEEQLLQSKYKHHDFSSDEPQTPP